MQNKRIGATKKKIKKIFVVSTGAIVIIVFQLLVPIAYADVGDLEISDGTVTALYHFDGDSVDSSGNGLNGSDTSMTYATTTQKLGSGAGSFDGTNSKITIADNNNLDFGTDSFSICYWINANDSGLGMVISKKNSGATASAGWAYYADDSTNYMYHNFSNGASENTGYTGSAILGEDWNFECIRRIDSTAITYFHNGSLDTTKAGSSIDVSNGIAMLFGDYAGGGAKYQGLIDEAIIFSGVVPTSTIEDLYNSGDGIEVCTTENCATGAATSTDPNCAVATGTIAFTDALDNDFVYEFLRLFLGIMITIMVLLGFPYLWSKLKNRK